MGGQQQVRRREHVIIEETRDDTRNYQAMASSLLKFFLRFKRDESTEEEMVESILYLAKKSSDRLCTSPEAIDDMFVSFIRKCETLDSERRRHYLEDIGLLLIKSTNTHKRVYECLIQEINGSLDLIHARLYLALVSRIFSSHTEDSEIQEFLDITEPFMTRYDEHSMRLQTRIFSVFLERNEIHPRVLEWAFRALRFLSEGNLTHIPMVLIRCHAYFVERIIYDSIMDSDDKELETRLFKCLIEFPLDRLKETFSRSKIGTFPDYTLRVVRERMDPEFFEEHMEKICEILLLYSHHKLIPFSEMPLYESYASASFSFDDINIGSRCMIASILEKIAHIYARDVCTWLIQRYNITTELITQEAILFCMCQVLPHIWVIPQLQVLYRSDADWSMHQSLWGIVTAIIERIMTNQTKRMVGLCTTGLRFIAAALEFLPEAYKQMPIIKKFSDRMTLDFCRCVCQWKEGDRRYLMYGSAIGEFLTKGTINESCVASDQVRAAITEFSVHSLSEATFNLCEMIGIKFDANYFIDAFIDLTRDNFCEDFDHTYQIINCCKGLVRAISSEGEFHLENLITMIVTLGHSKRLEFWQNMCEVLKRVCYCCPSVAETIISRFTNEVQKLPYRKLLLETMSDIIRNLDAASAPKTPKIRRLVTKYMLRSVPSQFLYSTVHEMFRCHIR